MKKISQWYWIEMTNNSSKRLKVFKQNLFHHLKQLKKVSLGHPLQTRSLLQPSINCHLATRAIKNTTCRSWARTTKIIKSQSIDAIWTHQVLIAHLTIQSAQIISLISRQRNVLTLLTIRDTRWDQAKFLLILRLTSKCHYTRHGSIKTNHKLFHREIILMGTL